MSGIKLLLIIVIAVLIVVLFKYVQIKRQIRNLSKQMTDLTTGKSEKMLDISLVDKDREYSLIKSRLMKDYKIVSDLLS